MTTPNGGPHPGRGTIQRMDNIVVADLAAAKAFFAELGLELEGEATVEGRAVDRIASPGSGESDRTPPMTRRHPRRAGRADEVTGR